MANIRWAPELEAEFRSMIAAELSSREIAGHFGITRSAVTGKAMRLGLKIRPETMALEKAARVARGAYKKVYQYRARPNRRKATTWMERIMARQLDLEFAPATTLEGVGKVAFLDLESWMCRWPSGDGAEMMFCGEPSIEGKPYCRCHLAMAYVPSQTITAAERDRRHFHALQNFAKRHMLPVAA